MMQSMPLSALGFKVKLNDENLLVGFPVKEGLLALPCRRVAALYLHVWNLEGDGLVGFRCADEVLLKHKVAKPRTSESRESINRRRV